MKFLNFIFLTVFCEIFNFDDFLNQLVPKFNQSCDSLENGKICETACGDDLLECAYACQDVECVDQCKMCFYNCTEFCPCHAEYPLGCAECDSWACLNECSIPEENPDKIKVWTQK